MGLGNILLDDVLLPFEEGVPLAHDLDALSLGAGGGLVDPEPVLVLVLVYLEFFSAM